MTENKGEAFRQAYIEDYWNMRRQEGRDTTMTVQPSIGQKCMIPSFGYGTVLNINATQDRIYVEFDPDMQRTAQWFSIDASIEFDTYEEDYQQII